ncbi:MAG: hypothetical protein KAR19_00350 [Bacteroidales bacterium]|nr:hypothetical protein [Bacteroidales bacterium]
MTEKLISKLLKNILKYHLFTSAYIWILLLPAFMVSCIQPAEPVNDQFSYAQERKDDLQLSIYITAHAVKNLLSDEAGRREAISIFRCNGITKAYIEVYRGGLVIEKNLLEDVRDLFEKNQIEVVGGIATVPGDNFGVRQEAQLGWFNWQNPKTQADLKEVMMMSADVFDEFIIDDFLCTADTSMESKAAKGDRSWSQYRRDLLTELSESVFIGPAKSINPDIKLIIKYPQWYDRFHLFGYDVENKTALYDKVWVGTESRGQYTQRYGFVQPYESFVSYKWMESLAGKKMGGAWFDHGDCDENDFIDQAWQSVLAGAQELSVFNYFDFVNGHKGHHLMRRQFTQLADLARKVATEPVKGVMAYKPANSNAYGDLYIMDFIGMLGVPLIPVSQYPENAKVIFLPTQAAADTEILTKIETSISNHATLIFTTGFLAHAKDGKRLAEIAGISWPLDSSPFVADQIIVEGKAETIKYGLNLESDIQLTEGYAKLVVRHNSDEIAFLVVREHIFTLNTHTFSQADFDKVGEVLLCPRPMGLLEIPQTWANTLRDQFLTPLGFDFNAPTRVTFQPYGDSGWVIQNYNQETVHIDLSTEGLENGRIEDKFSGKQVHILEGQINMEIPPRSRLWLEISDLE